LEYLNNCFQSIFIEKWVNWWHKKEMPVAVYGHYGFALLLVPTVAADFLEHEWFQLINVISRFIDIRKVKVFSINSINNKSWMNGQL
jgi:esterase/lipase superfamily enzyme